MNQPILVSQIMTTNIVVANLRNTFSQVMEFFTEYKIQHLPVTFDDKLIGILSVHDMTNYIYNLVQKGEVKDIASVDAIFKMEEVMTHNPVTVSVDDTITKVLDILSEGKFQSIPVVKDGLVHGIITNKDMVRIFKWHLEKQH